MPTPEVFRAAVAAAALRLTTKRGRNADEEKPIHPFTFFNSIPSGPSHHDLVDSGKVSRAMADPSLNRYCDCYPLDSHLCPTPSGTYLNASKVYLRDPPAPATIVAAGPMCPEWYGPETRPAFWEAVWHNRVSVVLALAVPKPGCQGCSAYVENETFGNVRVEVDEESESRDAPAVERKITLRWGEHTRHVTQVEFLAWPNYGVAEPDAVANLTRRVCELLHAAASDPDDHPHTVPPNEAAPLLVHCAGGVGRSGTFATLLSLWQDRHALPLTSSDEVLEAVKDRVSAFREQRHPYGVETHEQLELIVTSLNVLCDRKAAK